MPRKRNQPDWLPSRVYRGKSSYEFRPKEGGCIRLMKLAANETDEIKRELFNAHAKAKADMIRREDMNWLFDLYLASPQYQKTSKGDKENVAGHLKKLRPVFGKMFPKKVSPGHIRLYMDKRGAKYMVAANKEHGFLSRVFNWGMERNFCQSNPTEKVKKFEETPRDRYIEDWEYDLVYEVAKKSNDAWIAPAMEFSYLCRMRSGEVLGLLEDVHVLEDGIFVKRSKGSTNEITAWSPRLTQALKDAKQICNPEAPTRLTEKPIFKNRYGRPFSADYRKKAWARVRKLAMEKGLEIDGITVKLKEPFNFHDIKAKGITDHAEKAGGHKSKKMQAVYDRKPSIIASTR